MLSIIKAWRRYWKDRHVVEGRIIFKERPMSLKSELRRPLKKGSMEWIEYHQFDKKAKRLLEDNISSNVATWDSLRDNAVLKEHFRDVARGIKKDEHYTGN